MSDLQMKMMEKGLDACIERNRGTPFERILKSPIRLPLSKIAEKLCIYTGNTLSLKARTFWDEPMNVVFPEIVSCFLYRYGYFEPDLTRLVMRYVKPGNTFLDIGTHFGYYSLLAAKLVGEKGQVHSFEPTANTYRVVASNLEGKSNVRLNNLAVWSESTTLSFKDYGNTLSAFNSLYGAKLEEAALKGLKPTVYDVKTTTIDEYTASANIRPDFIKIDAENAEFDILSGMPNTLSRIKPIVTLEVGDVNTGDFKNSAESVRFLTDHRYTAHEWKNGALVKHTLAESYKHTNLIFLPDDS